MSDGKGAEKGKANFLDAGISTALPQKGTTPPPPPVVRRPKERNVGDEQTSENANLQLRKNETVPAGVVQESLEREQGNALAGVMTDEQVRLLAQMLTSANATTQPDKKAKRQKIDLAELLLETIANCEGSETIKEQFRKLATSQKTKINQGVFAPEALFTIYNSATAQMKLAGKKATMSDLMAKALIAYIPEIIRELEQEEK